MSQAASPAVTPAPAPSGTAAAAALPAPDKFDKAGRLARFIRGRERILWIRVAYELAGSAIVWALNGPERGAIALAACLIGETVEMGLLAWVRRRALVQTAPERAEALILAGSVVWALAMSAGVIAIWVPGDSAMWFISLAYLLAASVNAMLIGSLHPPSLWAKEAIFSLVLAGLFVSELARAGPSRELVAFAIGAAIMAATLAGLFARLHLQNRRRHEAEAALVQANQATAAANEQLRASREALRRRAEEAQKLAEHARAASLAKSRFLATMSHEIRTPMNGILGTLELMRDTPLSPEQAEHVETIARSGEALMALINDILDFSKIEAGHLVLKARPFRPAAVIEDALAVVRPLARDKGLRLEVVGAVPAEAVLEGDPDRLRQILINLLGNAVKFTHEGHVRLLARLEPASGAPGEPADLEIAVEDTGPGIAPEDQERVFRSFEQARDDMARHTAGRGWDWPSRTVWRRPWAARSPCAR
ncbi:MAG: hypothetical protein D6832_04870, partial [Alphaproteobacteria bacterium]